MSIMLIRSGAEMDDLMRKVERYRSRANTYGEMAKTAEPPYLRNFYMRVALRYVFMAEDLTRRAETGGKDGWNRYALTSRPAL